MASQETKLSNVLLEMKFMQRTKLRLQKEEEKKENRKLERSFLQRKDIANAGSSNSNAVTIKEEPATSRKVKYVFNANSNDIEDQMFGRMSFKGFNPEIEKVMKYYKDVHDGVEPEDDTLDGKDVGDTEMADIFSGGGTEKGLLKKNYPGGSRTIIDENSWSANRDSRRRQGRSHPYSNRSSRTSNRRGMR